MGVYIIKGERKEGVHWQLPVVTVVHWVMGIASEVTAFVGVPAAPSLTGCKGGWVPYSCSQRYKWGPYLCWVKT